MPVVREQQGRRQDYITGVPNAHSRTPAKPRPSAHARTQINMRGETET